MKEITGLEFVFAWLREREHSDAQLHEDGKCGTRAETPVNARAKRLFMVCRDGGENVALRKNAAQRAFRRAISRLGYDGANLKF